MESTGKTSGLIEFIPENVEKVPEQAGVYQVVAAGQKVLYVGLTGDRTLRESLFAVLDEQPFGAIEYFRYRTQPDADAARALADEWIEEHKPPHNLGYGRFRNEEVKLPKQGHSIRHAAPNP